MNAGGSTGQGHIGAGINEQSGCRLPDAGRWPHFADDAHCFAGKRFQFAGGQVLFAELDVVDAGLAASAILSRRRRRRARSLPGKAVRSVM